MASRFPLSTPPKANEPPALLGADKPEAQTFECDACGKSIEGEPAGRGLYVWTRGEETRYEEPPLCSSCANAIGLAALAQWELEEDGE
jgi:hypothetical protein